MYKQRRRPELSQHFLRNRQLVQRLVRRAAFAASDTILEIGPGKGIITQELLHEAGQVLAVELDTRLIEYLTHKFAGQANLTLFAADFLDFHLPVTPYHVFANTPFAVEGEIIRKLLEAPNPPRQTYLVLIKEVAERWAGARGNTQFAVLYGPWFDFKIVHHFSRQDFDPAPRIDSVMLKIQHRPQPFVSASHRDQYVKFVKAGFGGGRRLNQNLATYFSKTQMNRVTRQHRINFQARPSDLTLEQWLTLFRLYLELNHSN